MLLPRYEPNVVPLVHELRESCFNYEAMAELLGEVLGRGTGRSLLSLGCGTGSLEWRLAKLGFSVVGIDVDPAAVEHSREICRQEGEEVLLVVADMFEPAIGRPADAVLLLYTETPLAGLQVLLSRLRPMVKAGGLFVANVALSSEASIGSSLSFIDIFRENAAAAVCLSAYVHRLKHVRGKEVYLSKSEGGFVSLASDFTEVPIEHWSKTEADSRLATWAPAGWHLEKTIDLDDSCPSAAPPFCEQILVILRRKEDVVDGRRAI